MIYTLKRDDEHPRPFHMGYLSPACFPSVDFFCALCQLPVLFPVIGQIIWHLAVSRMEYCTDLTAGQVTDIYCYVNYTLRGDILCLPSHSKSLTWKRLTVI